MRKVASIDATRCIACGRCSRECPFEAIGIGKLSIRVVDEEACTGCLVCKNLCPHFAINAKESETVLTKKRKAIKKERKMLPIETYTTTPITAIPKKWDLEVDVVIIGYGASGATTALTAAEAGAEVLILEKMPFGGGNSATLHEAPGVVSIINEEKGMEHLKWLTSGLTEENVLKANLTYSANKLQRFLEKVHLPLFAKPFVMPYGEYTNAPGHGNLGNALTLDIKGGPVFYEALAKVTEDVGVKVSYNTRALRLIQNPQTREIIGVIAECEGREIAIKGRKATVLATGGFGFNGKMLRQYIEPCPIYFVGSTASTGDGIRMAQAVGAQLWHMNGRTGPMQWAIKGDNEQVYNTFSELGMDHKAAGEAMGGAQLTPHPSAFLSQGSFIWVNKYGNRFDCEIDMVASLDDIHGEHHREKWFSFDAVNTVEYRNIPAFQIFDEKARLAGPLVEIRNMTSLPWSEGAVEEIKKGWIIKGNTIEELAENCKINAITGVARGGAIPPDVLRQTVERYNANCRAGSDPDFGRTLFLKPLDTPPYYAMGPMFPSFIITYGGPKHNDKQQVLDVDNNPIPRLYAVGDCGSLNASRYAFFGGTEMLTSGLICGDNVVREKPING